MDFTQQYINMCKELHFNNLDIFNIDEIQYDIIYWFVIDKCKKCTNCNRDWYSTMNFCPDCGNILNNYYKTHIFTRQAINGCEEQWPIYTQDQLQSIYLKQCDNGELIKSCNKYIVMLDDFLEFINFRYSGIDFNYIYQFTSFEQLWLAFVMLVIYNKKWNNQNNKWEELIL